MAKKRRFRKIKGRLQHDCDDCGKRRLLKFYDREGNYICGPCKEKAG